MSLRNDVDELVKELHRVEKLTDAAVKRELAKEKQRSLAPLYAAIAVIIAAAIISFAISWGIADEQGTTDGAAANASSSEVHQEGN